MFRSPAALAACLVALSAPLSAQFPVDQLVVASAGKGSVVGFDLGATALGQGAPAPGGQALVDDGTINFGATGAGDLAFGPDGNLYVAAIFAGAVTVVAPNGATTTLGGELKDFAPTSLAFGMDGHLFVSSSVGDNALHEFDAEGNHLRAFGPAAGIGGVTVTGLALDAGGHIFASVFNLDVVKEYDREGKFVRNIGSGAITEPRDLVFGPDGNLWVTSQSKDKILVYATTGQPKASFDGDGLLDEPSGLAFGADGTLYVANLGSHDVTIFLDPLDQDGVEGFGFDGALTHPDLLSAMSLALAPQRFEIKAKGSFAAPGQPAQKLKGSGILSVDLGSRLASLRFFDDGNGLVDALGTPHLSLSGFWGAESDAAKSSQLHFTQIAQHASSGGSAALQLTLSSKLDKTIGRGAPKKASGTLSRGGAQGVVFLTLKGKPVKE